MGKPYWGFEPPPRHLKMDTSPPGEMARRPTFEGSVGKPESRFESGGGQLLNKGGLAKLDQTQWPAKLSG